MTHPNPFVLSSSTPMIRGRRYATLPFLYDDDAAAIRADNNRFLDAGVDSYNAAVNLPN